MARSNLFVALILIALASLAVPVGGQQAETTPTTGQKQEYPSNNLRARPGE
jgi:hypothetical protein